MRYKPEHKEQSRARMLAAAGRGFRSRGYGGIGVDGLAKEAQVTSGAFYGHFPSKEAAFREAVAAGMGELEAAVLALREQQGGRWLEVFVDFYLGDRRTCELAESCAMQSLSPEVARASGAVKAAFEAGMLRVVEAVAAGLEDGSLADRRRRSWSLLAILAGGVTLARAVEDPRLSTRIAASIRAAALAAAGPAG